MKSRVGIESRPAPMAKIQAKPKLPKPYKGKALRGPRVSRGTSRPAGGGRKGY